MKSIVWQINKKMHKTENDHDGINDKLVALQADYQDLQLKYNQRSEEYEKLTIDYDVLDKDVQDLFQIEKQFNEMKKKQYQLYSNLNDKEV